MTFIAMIAALSGLSGCSFVQTVMPVLLTDANVVSLLNTFHQSEIEAGQLAMQRASSENVRSFAVRLVTENQRMMEDTGQLVLQMNVQPNKSALALALESDHRKAMEELRNTSGLDFDKAYIAHQTKIHDRAVNLVQDMEHSVTSSHLRQHLHETAMNLHSHFAAARSLAHQVMARQ
jgi:putative membrane protein